MGGSQNLSCSKEIGGYFELALPDHGESFPFPYLKLQSARAALRALLEARGFRSCWVPAFICNSVLDAIRDAGCMLEFYHLDDSYNPRITKSVSTKAAFLYVNYFGLCRMDAESLERQVPLQHVIVDNTQALFAAPGHVYGSIYSPRKFVGVPDGGLLISSATEIVAPVRQDVRSVERMDHLLTRMAVSARAGYAMFLQANQSLEDTTPLRMSCLTERMLRSIDMHVVKRRRQANFMKLAQAFDAMNVVQWKFEAESVPLCYPLVVERSVAEIRRHLAARNIYIPTYWEEARTRIKEGSVEHELLDRCLALPCDQRYSSMDIERVILEVMTVLDKY